MANINNVVIGKNHIKYYDEILKVSNISRTWVFRFQNVEKRKFEEEKRAYKNAKTQYEECEARKKKESIRNILIGAAIFLFISLSGFSANSVIMGLLCLCVTGVLAYVAFGIYKREINYPYPPPAERMIPDKFGLGIEMNSGHKVTFTAIGDDGVRALRKLQNDIEDADVHKDIIYFNMNDYNISVENNDGVINTGDFANNTSKHEVR
ncbi:MAG: hypothetical protein HFH72_07725 [Lachnospiraceae bacterium]|nr:hypothetical protein [Lachnospiraceae bacterium]